MGEKGGQRPALALVGPLSGALSGTGWQVAPAGGGVALRAPMRGHNLVWALSVSQL